MNSIGLKFNEKKFPKQSQCFFEELPHLKIEAFPEIGNRESFVPNSYCPPIHLPPWDNHQCPSMHHRSVCNPRELPHQSCASSCPAWSADEHQFPAGGTPL